MLLICDSYASRDVATTQQNQGMNMNSMNANALGIAPSRQLHTFTEGVESGWHRFSAEGLSAYQVHHVLDWCVAATGGAGTTQRLEKKSEPAWHHRQMRELRGYVYVPRTLPHGVKDLCEVFLNTPALADAFRAAWCAQPMDDAMRSFTAKRRAARQAADAAVASTMLSACVSTAEVA